MDTIVSKLQRNPKEIYLETSRLLVLISDNILKQPTNQKLRTLQKSNRSITNKILNVFGGLECLKFMGFIDVPTALILPEDGSLDRIKNVRDNLKKCEKAYLEYGQGQPEASASKSRNDEVIMKIELPPYKQRYENPFLDKIAYNFHGAQLYDNMYLRERALALIPVRQLEINAQENMRELQAELKKSEDNDFDATIQDMLLLELLNWFKNDFFTWVDTPPCQNCNGHTKFSHSNESREQYAYAQRVEWHICETCNTLTTFPRYHDLNILMETRRGRCGEWANVFTLFCRAMRWDARYIYDAADHVWTEVYSFGAKRWLHCDPCENVCDTPLLYETGWKKQITYVFAFSGEEVQDVTWRYTSNFQEVLQRRQNCTEIELATAIVDLRTERQKQLSEYRRKYLTQRVLEEICELMVEKKPTDKDKRGRSSGSLSWRLARGEDQHQLKDFFPYIWKFFDDDLEENCVKIRYSTSSNRYEMFSGTNRYFHLDEWHKGLYQVEDIFRKEENDWKMVYLSRTSNTRPGTIQWSFDVNSQSKVFDIVEIKFDYDLFQSGKIELKAVGDKHEIKFLKDEKHIRSQLLSGSTRIDIVARLSGGDGDVAWQHVQLFRQSLDSKEFGFEITFTFKKQ